MAFRLGRGESFVQLVSWNLVQLTNCVVPIRLASPSGDGVRTETHACRPAVGC